MQNKAMVDSNILVFAFRYALGRQTSAPEMVIEAIKGNIDLFEEWEKRLIIKEIDECKHPGMECDVLTWLAFKNWLKSNLAEG